MNNPEANFMSPLRAQPAKKQRGGTTPSRGGTRGGGPPTSSAASNADDAIARRRAELRRLQQQRTTRSAVRPEVTSTTELLGKGSGPPRGGNAGPPLSASGPPPTGSGTALSAASGPPPTLNNSIPQPGNLERVRHSDIFPTVPKPTKTAANGTAKPPIAASTGTMTTLAASASASSSSRPPPPPPVARKLEFSSSAASRAKSAPPSRPPPPPSTPKPPSKEAPPVMRSTPTPSRARPAPVTASNLVPPKNKSTTAAQTPKASSSTGSKSKDEPGVSMVETTPAPKSKSSQPIQKTPHPSKGVSSSGGPPPTKEPYQKTPYPSKGRDIDTSASSSSSGPPPLAMETPKAAASSQQTPKDGTEPSAPPSTARRDRIRALRDAMDSPPAKKDVKTTTSTMEDTSPSNPITVERLESAYRQAEEEKKQALQQISQLEEKLKEAEKAKSDAMNNASSSADDLSSHAGSTDYLAQMVQVADTQGEEAALKWARSQLSGGGGGGLLSPMAGIPGSPAGRMFQSDASLSGRSRKVTPVEPPPTPVLSDPEDSALPKVQMERRYFALYKEAATTIPFEYTSATATFVIRRPYGIETAPALFDVVSPMHPHTDYSRKAHVSTTSTIEVAVTITADNSLLLLFDKAGVRYRTNPFGEFKEISNVEEQQYIGTVNYIDQDAMEQSYSLDDIYQEAMQLREHYCATLATTAMAFKNRPKEVVVQEVPTSANGAAPPSAEPPAKKPATNEMCVGTDGDIPYPPAEITVPQDSKKNKKKEADTVVKKKKGDAPPQKPIDDTGDEAAASGDVLAIFIGMIFKSIFGLIYWILIGLPISIIKTSIVMIGSLFILSMVYLYMMQEYNAGLLSSSPSIGTTSEFYFSNAPGIM